MIFSSSQSEYDTRKQGLEDDSIMVKYPCTDTKYTLLFSGMILLTWDECLILLLRSLRGGVVP